MNPNVTKALVLIAHAIESVAHNSVLAPELLREAARLLDEAEA